MRQPSPATSFSVANINPGSVRSEFMLSVMALVEKQRALGEDTPVRFDQFYAQLSGPYLDDERNQCALWFMNHTDSDYLVFIDSDIGFNPNQVFTLVRTAHENGVTILSGVYYNQFHHLGGLRALIHNWEPDERFGGARNLIAVTPDYIDSLSPSDKPHQVGACGAGFLAIHRSVLIDMQNIYELPQPYFAELNFNGIHMGEDFTFCIRANALNHPTYVLPSIQVTHYKTCGIRPIPSPSPTTPH
jgi:glycosyltransferase involved in cell wall biosynthesis